MAIRISVLIGFLFIVQSYGLFVSEFSPADKLPCDLIDSSNITDGTYFPNKSIIYYGMEFPKGTYARVTYVMLRSHIPHWVKPHIRGCLCNIKPCLPMCCTSEANGQCNAKNFTFKYRTINVINKHPDFYAQHFNSFLCNQIYTYSGTRFHITQDGHVAFSTAIFSLNSTVNHHDYCMFADVNDTAGALDLNIDICNEKPKRIEETKAVNKADIFHMIVQICMLTSVLCIITTLIVYGWIREIRKFNEKCLMCYLIVLAIGFSLLVTTELEDLNMETVHPYMCIFIGYTINFCFLAAFAWLNVINFNVWLSVQTMNKFKQLGEKKQFMWYMGYGYGIPGCITLAMFIFGSNTTIPSHREPEVIECFPLNVTIDPFIFILPAFILIVLNVLLFILAAQQILQLNVESDQNQDQAGPSQDNNEEVQRILMKKRNAFMLYLRLFVVAGVSWVIELFWIFFPSIEYLHSFADIISSLQGVFIFILFVTKRSVFESIQNRWNNAARRILVPLESQESEMNNVDGMEMDAQLINNELSPNDSNSN